MPQQMLRSVEGVFEICSELRVESSSYLQVEREVWYRAVAALLVV